MSDSVEYLKQGFAEGVAELPDDVVINLLPQLAHELGLHAARSVMAPLIWAERVGETIDTSEAVRLLDVTRQALAKRVAAGTLLGLPGRGTTHYPAWQFDFARRELSPQAREIFQIFKGELGNLDPYAVSAWMTTPSEDLAGLTPRDWLDKDKDPASLFEAARRTAGRLAS